MSARGFITSSTRSSWKARAWLTSWPVAAVGGSGVLAASFSGQVGIWDPQPGQNDPLEVFHRLSLGVVFVIVS
jgi:hypothetical protein